MNSRRWYKLSPRERRAARILVPGAEYAERGFRASRRGKGAERRVLNLVKIVNFCKIEQKIKTRDVNVP